MTARRYRVTDPEHEMAVARSRVACGEDMPLFASARTAPPTTVAPESPATASIPRHRGRIATSAANAEYQAKRMTALRSRIYRELMARGLEGLTRRELSRVASIDISTICSSVDAMIRDGHVAQTERQRSGGYVLVTVRGPDGRTG